MWEHPGTFDTGPQRAEEGEGLGHQTVPGEELPLGSHWRLHFTL